MALDGRVNSDQYEKANHVAAHHAIDEGFVRVITSTNANLDAEMNITAKTSLVQDYLSKHSIAFFMLGMLIAIPCMIITTAANAMFSGVTGAYGICLSATAASTSFLTPLFAHRIHFAHRTLLSASLGLASFGVCALGSTKAGPAIGTMLAGATYAFGTNTYLALAAFFPQYTVVSFSIGSGFSAVFGPALYIGFMKALDQSWKKCFLICLPFPACIPLIWWGMLSKERRSEAERVRRLEIGARGTIDTESVNGGCNQIDNDHAADSERNGFSSARTRMSLFLKVIFPRYVIPLLCCTTCGVFVLFGLAPTFQELERFQSAPRGNLEFEICFLAYGFGQFLFSTLSMRFKLTFIWGWAGLQILITILGFVQLFRPFLRYYTVWAFFMFLVGGLVGGGVTNTNFKIADDFRLKGEPEEVRSFAMSYGGLGNFGGDAIGGAFAIAVEVLATKHLSKGRHQVKIL